MYLEAQLVVSTFAMHYRTLYNELCKTRVLIGLEECVIRV